MVPASPYRLSLEETLKLAAEGPVPRFSAFPGQRRPERLINVSPLLASSPEASRWRHPTATVFSKGWPETGRLGQRGASLPTWTPWHQGAPNPGAVTRARAERRGCWGARTC